MDTDARHGTPRPAPEMDAAAQPTRAQRCLQSCPYVFFMALVLFLVSFVLWLIVEEVMYKEPNYSVTITAVSGLDPATDLGRRPALDPEFNLTVLVAPRSDLMHACGFPGTTLRVTYHGFELASAALSNFCETRGRLTVNARGGRVWLPGPALDDLAADLQRAAGAFDVTISISNMELWHGVVHGMVISCMGRRIGEDAGGAALCDVREVETYAH
ncbi:unnamed protein product [Alopecurus aequalis]